MPCIAKVPHGLETDNRADADSRSGQPSDGRHSFRLVQIGRQDANPDLEPRRLTMPTEFIKRDSCSAISAAQRAIPLEAVSGRAIDS